jgi:hypothetical protein
MKRKVLGANGLRLRKGGWLLTALFVSVVSADGQTSFEVTPLIGWMYGGSVELQQDVQPNIPAKLDNAVIFGVAGGFRFNGDDCASCNLVEFRWMRQKTYLNINTNAPNISVSRPSVTINHFLADFTHEWPIEETHERVTSFLTGSLGAANMSTPADTGIRFEFGIGGGVKVFLKRHWGFRFYAEYLPMLMEGEVQKVVCAGGCIVLLNGQLMNQFAVTVGPIFRF